MTCLTAEDRQAHPTPRVLSSRTWQTTSALRYAARLAALTLSMAAAQSLLAQPVVKLNDSVVEDVCAHFFITAAGHGTTSNDRIWVTFDDDVTIGGDDDWRSRRFTGNAASSKHMNVCQFAPETTYWFNVTATSNSGTTESNPLTCSVNCTDCSDSHDSAMFAAATPFSCTIGEPPRFTTTAREDPTPALPVHSFSLPPAPPTINGSALTVSVDGNNLCTDLQAKLNAAAALNADLNHKVVVPAGAICRPENESSGSLTQYKLPCKASGTGWVWITSDSDDKLLPPWGTQIDYGYKPHLFNIEFNIGDWDWQDFDNLRQVWVNPGSSDCGGVDSEGWILDAARIGYPPHEEMTPKIYTVTSVSGSPATATLSPNHSFVNGQIVWVNITDSGVKYGTGVCFVSAAEGTGNQLRCGNPSTQFEGSCVSDCGAVTLAVSLPIASVSNTTPPVVTTVSDHNLPDHPVRVIGAIDDATDTITVAGHDYRTRQSIEISGAPEGNGVYWVESISGDDLHLSVDYLQRRQGINSIDFGGNCSSSCGSVERLSTIQVFDVSGSTTANGSHIFRVDDADEITLVGATAGGAGTGGYLTLETGTTHQILGAGSRVDRMIFNRVILDGGFPYSTRFGAAFRRNTIFADSLLRDINHWGPRNPISNDASPDSAFRFFSGNNVNSAFATEGINFSGAINLQFLNTTLLNVRGISMFADGGGTNPASGGSAQDITIDGMTIWSTDEYVADNPRSHGRHYSGRHLIELKNCERCYIGNSTFRGNSSGTNDAGTISFSLRGEFVSPVKTIRDVTVEWNLFDLNLASVFRVENAEGTEKNVLFGARIGVRNNLITGLDSQKWEEDPGSDLNCCGSSDRNTGYLMKMDGGYKEVRMDHITFLHSQGRDPAILAIINHPIQGWQLTNSVVSYSKNNGDGQGINAGFGSGTNNHLPAPVVGGPSKAFLDSMTRQGGTPDPESFVRDTVIIPCVEDTYDESGGVAGFRDPDPDWFESRYASTADSSTIRKDEAETEWLHNPGNGAWTGLLFPGADGSAPTESCVTREEEVFTAGNYTPHGAFSGKGVDEDELKSHLGVIEAVAVNADSDTQVTISWDAPDTEPCTVDITHTTLDFSNAANITRSQYSGAPATAQSVVFSGLTPGQQYAYRLNCRRPGLRGEFSLSP